MYVFYGGLHVKQTKSSIDTEQKKKIDFLSALLETLLLTRD